jgi:hypothetical protein
VNIGIVQVRHKRTYRRIERAHVSGLGKRTPIG